MTSLRRRLLWVGIGIGVIVAVLYGRVIVYRETKVPTTSSVPVAEVPGGEKDFITLLYHERSPYSETVTDGVHGLCADPANAAFQRAGIPYQWQRMPAKRHLETIARNEGKMCAVGWFKNPEREKIAKFTTSIYQDEPTQVLAKADNDRIRNGFTIEQLMSDRRLRLLLKDGYSYGGFIDESILRFTPRIVTTSGDNMGMLRMIHSHRADYFFIAGEEAFDLLRRSGIEKEAFKLVRISDMPQGNRRYILCNQNVEDDVLSRLNAAIQKNAHGETPREQRE